MASASTRPASPTTERAWWLWWRWRGPCATLISKRPKRSCFVADVGEEGRGKLAWHAQAGGNLSRRLRYVIALDGASTDYVITTALASRRVEVTITGPGGHSWSDFGAPNPIHAAARAIAQFVNTPVPENPRSSFNVGEIQGGTSVNSIPASASLKVDLRSESEANSQSWRRRFASPCSRAFPTRWQRRAAAAWAAILWTSSSKCWVFVPAERCPLIRLCAPPCRRPTNTSATRVAPELSSTDANIPLSLGIPAIAIGAGGLSAGAHSPGEWYNPLGREMGLKRALLTVLGVAGIDPRIARDPPMPLYAQSGATVRATRTSSRSSVLTLLHSPFLIRSYPSC